MSRKRALQLIAGAMAVAVPARVPQTVEAGKNRKPPLAFVGVTVDSVTATSATVFSWQVSGVLAHPASDMKGTITWVEEAASNLPTDKVRAKIVASLKGEFASTLQKTGHDVPQDRVAVTLL